jgi:hypothetical protein
VLEEGSFLAIFGLEFLSLSQMIVDLAHWEYYVSFAPAKRRKFENLVGEKLVPEAGVKNLFTQLAVGASTVVEHSLSTMFEKPEEEAQEREMSTVPFYTCFIGNLTA